MRICFLLFLTVLGLYFCGCSTADSEGARLTRGEQDAILSHIRTFIQRSKVRLTPAERAYIMTHEPTFNVEYTGYKEGALTVRWSLPRHRNFLVSRTGKLLANDRADWTMRLVTDKSSQLVPQDFFGANGEDLSLPPL